jgi:hypothetical protein
VAGAALKSLHAAPRERWNAESLARRVQVSRKRHFGLPPGDWRKRQAPPA